MIAVGQGQGLPQGIGYIVSGIGFLGAGLIMKEGASVRGLNTAATVWCSAAMGPRSPTISAASPWCCPPAASSAASAARRPWQHGADGQAVGTVVATCRYAQGSTKCIAATDGFS